jgi:hypothetical protein
MGESVVPALALLALVCLSIVMFVVGGVTYRLYFSPLSKFPGPKLAAATLWYEFYYDAIRKGRYTFKIMELHRTYGKWDLSWRICKHGPDFI